MSTQTSKHKEPLIFPYFFETEMYSCWLKSKYEAVTIYRDSQFPKINFVKREGQYVPEYRAWLQRRVVAELTAAEFRCRLEYATELMKNVGGVDELEECEANNVALVSHSLVKLSTENIDRHVYEGGIVITANGNDYALSGRFYLNRYGDIKFGNLYPPTLIDDLYNDTIIGVGGAFLLTISDKEFVEMPAGESLPVDPRTNLSRLYIYDIDEMVSGDNEFTDEFNNDFNT